MHTKNRNWRTRSRFTKEALQPFLEQKPRLRQLMIRFRARGEPCQLDKGETLLGPGLRFKNGSLLKLAFTSRNRLLRRRAELKPRKPRYPAIVFYQGRYLKMLREPGSWREF